MQLIGGGHMGCWRLQNLQKWQSKSLVKQPLLHSVRNLSTFSLIHTKQRNRLLADKLDKLVFCHYNMRLRLKLTEQRAKKQRELELKKRKDYDPYRQRDEDEDEAAQNATVDELFEDDHPLHSWVRVREEVDEPLFDPTDTTWAEGELDNIRSIDPEFLNLEKRPRRSTTEAPLVHPLQPAATAPEPPINPIQRHGKQPMESASQPYSKFYERTRRPQKQIPSRAPQRREESDKDSSIGSDDSTQSPSGDGRTGGTRGRGDAGGGNDDDYMPSYSLGIDSERQHGGDYNYGQRDYGHRTDERQPSESGSYVGSATSGDSHRDPTMVTLGPYAYDPQAYYHPTGYAHGGGYPTYNDPQSQGAEVSIFGYGPYPVGYAGQQDLSGSSGSYPRHDQPALTPCIDLDGQSYQLPISAIHNRGLSGGFDEMAIALMLEYQRNPPKDD